MKTELEEALAFELEGRLEDILPLSFAGNGGPTLDWAAVTDNDDDVDYSTVVDRTGNLYRVEVLVLLHRLGPDADC